MPREGTAARGAGPSRIHRVAANIGLATVSAALFLLLLEGGLRLHDLLGGTPLIRQDPATTLFDPHPYLPMVLRPSSRYRDGDTSGEINSLGFRGPERSASKTPGTFRIICVGGSTTFGAGIRGDDRTYPAFLERRLEEAWPERRVEVWNAGVPGYTTAENAIYISLRLVDFSPDLIVLYEGYNDFKPNRYPAFRSDYAHWRDRARVPRRSPLESLRLYARLHDLAQRWLVDPAAEVRDPASGEKLRRHDSVGEAGLAVFERNLRSMVAVSRAGGAAVALATYAHPCTAENLERRPDLFVYLPRYQPNLTFAGVQDAFRRYNDAIRKVARSEGAVLADAEIEIPPDPALFVDHVHFNARGAELFAGVVAQAIREGLPPVDGGASARAGAAAGPAAAAPR